MAFKQVSLDSVRYPETLNTRTSYSVFVPRIIDPNKKATEVISKIKNKMSATKKEIKKGQSNVLTKNGDQLYLLLPFKPFNLDINHSYEKKAVIAGNKAVSLGINAMKQAGKGAIGKITQSTGGQLFGLDKVKNTLLAQAGVTDYTPERNLYQNSSASPISFNWTLSPKNATEATSIYKIIKGFQFYSMTQEPSSLKENGSSKFFIRNPAIWRIRFTSDKKDLFEKQKGKDGKDVDVKVGEQILDLSDDIKLPNHLFIKDNEFSDMVCTNVSTSFGESEFMTLIRSKNNFDFPVEIKLAVTFDFYYDMGSTVDFLGIKNFQDIINTTIT